MVNISKQDSGDSFRIVLSPNCSISWHELVIFYLFTCVIAIAVGLFFTLQGMWLVLPFSGLEMLALGIGLYVTSRKVYRKEVITLDPDRTRVEKGVQRVVQSWEFKTPWVRIIDETTGTRNPARRLAIGMRGTAVEVGSFLANSEKDELAFKLKDCIIRV
ncbi:MAG: DUF2244 domain-containing protein [Gammaproteobacteria bacterium]|nr:DUF2244 domain-containing protein [Gammaproteobacteria bacterium]MDH3859379.1 DUF2244 domain-containing protein [Gammaproteobacteria bacterium]